MLGDGAAWIWHLADEHVPREVQIVDWFHASERVWDLGRALHGDGTAKTEARVDRQLARLAVGEATAIRDEQVTSFTNQAARMAYDEYRADGWDTGSGDDRERRQDGG